MPAVYRSITAQSLHYYSRPHEGIPDTPLDSPAAWSGPALQQRSDWRETISDDFIGACDRALTHARATGKPVESLTADDFPLPEMAGTIDRWRDTLSHGLGFVFLRGFPVARWGEADSSLVFWCLGWHLGLPGAQNRFGELLGHVRDTGADPNDPTVREYRTPVAIRFHCDNADVVGLMCLQTAKQGGESRIASSVTIFNRILQESPELAARLFRPVALDARAEGGLRFFPVTPSRYYQGVLRTFWHSGYFESAERYEDAPRLDEQAKALIARFDAIASEEALDMDLVPGDIQLCSNHTIVHSRAAYTDHQDPERRRHLLRLWLSLPQSRGFGYRWRKRLNQLQLVAQLARSKLQQ